MKIRKKKIKKIGRKEERKLEVRMEDRGENKRRVERRKNVGSRQRRRTRIKLGRTD